MLSRRIGLLAAQLKPVRNFSAWNHLNTRMASDWSDFQHEPAERSGVVNPIRQMLEREMKPPVNHPKKLINLGLGEPTAENGFILPSQISDALIDAVKSGAANGYTQAAGNPLAREAVAKRFSEKENPIDPNNVFLT